MRTRFPAIRARHAARWAVALLLVCSFVASALPSAATPSAAEVAAARKRLEELNRRLIAAVEEYNQARLALEEVRRKLGEARTERTDAIREADAARRQLGRNASRAYQSIGSQFASLFDAGSLTDFADRLEFIGNLAQSDLDTATRAEAAQERARRAADRFREAIDERREVLRRLGERKKEIGQGVAEARRLYATLNRDFQETVRGSGSYDTRAPSVSDAQVQDVLNAAFSVRGVRYVFGASSPSYGFDCSGLTMWAWSHAGVSLPHSSAAQYAVLPHVSRSELRPGDLLFFYSPISHVGIYLTGSTMIDANHPGDVVNVRPIHWENFVGAARP
ncbi:MAG: NlpC/P60 family protein [Actinomycetota bacterium]